jgi:hypothetical protein
MWAGAGLTDRLMDADLASTPGSEKPVQVALAT